ncbi:YcnI family copper-binding membrane protein [Kineococcus sp. SYSU DK004]|uniref:YcnI family copper-binding membrane protein n=1 Tax=Kineococcus sp. SYSU DK004 TaxID=3383125 RepID=UPI003D7D86CD
MPSTTPTPRPRALARAGAAVLAVTGLTLLAGAPAASAHVRAVPETTAAGGWSVVTLRVPTESDTAASTSLEVSLPTDTPFTSVRVRPLPGWTAVVSEGELPEPVDVDGVTLTRAPLTVTWTADGPGTGVGEFEQFQLQVGPLPAAGTRVVLPAVQTYADGEVAAWTEVGDPGAAEPEHPAPEFTTTEAAGDGHGAHGAAPADEAEERTAPVASTADGSDGGSDGGPDGVARGLAGAGLAAGLGGLALGLRARRRSA